MLLAYMSWSRLHEFSNAVTRPGVHLGRKGVGAESQRFEKGIIFRIHAPEHGQDIFVEVVAFEARHLRRIRAREISDWQVSFSAKLSEVFIQILKPQNPILRDRQFATVIEKVFRVRNEMTV